MINNQNDGSNSLLYSILLSMENIKNYKVTPEDERYLLNQNVSKCKVKIYTLVITMLSEGRTYEEIFNYINEINIEEYKKLNDEEQNYIQRSFRKDLKLRQRKLEK